MLDKEVKSYMDKAYMDEAWNKMEQVLDTEMPVEKKDRRRIIWFWVAAGLILLISGSIYLVGQNWEARDNAPETNGPVAGTTPSKNNIAQFPATEKSSTTDNNKIKSSLTPETTTGSNTPKTRPTSRGSLTSSQLIDKNESTPQIPSETPVLAASQTATPQEASTSSKQPVSVQPTTPAVNSATVKAIATLDNFSVNKTSRPFKFEEGAVKLQKKSIPKKLIHEIYANGQSTSITALKGYEAGISLGKQLKNPRWTVFAGAGFQSEVRSLDINSKSYVNTSSETSQDVADVYVTPINVSAGFSYTDDQSNLSGGFSPIQQEASSSGNINLNVQLNYLTLPLNIAYRLTPRFSIKAGITPSIFLNGKMITQDNFFKATMENFDSSVTPNSINFPQNSNSIPLANNRYIYFTKSVIEPAKIHRFRLPANIGMQYHISKRFGLSADYQTQLTSVVNKGYFKTNRHRFRLGGFWRF